MIRLEVRDFFASRGQAFHVDPHVDPSHYQDLMMELASQVLEPGLTLTIKSRLHRDGYVLIGTDLPDFAPATPASLTEHYDGPYYGEAMLALIGQSIGWLQSFAVQHDGRVFHDVMPMKAHSTLQTFGSSRVTLEMHTELAFIDNPPEFLMLYCVRQDSEMSAETHLYDSRHALGTLSRDQFRQLTREGYRFGVDAGATGTVDEIEEPLPIFDRATSRLLRYDIDLCEPLGEEFRNASDALTQALLGMRISIRLRAGQMILIDNQRMVHSRNAFKAKFDGTDRWLKRAFVTAQKSAGSSNCKNLQEAPTYE